MPLIDTHAHLCDPSFDEDRAAVLDRAAAAGVMAVVAVGETLMDAECNLQLAAEYPRRILPAAGLFPSHLDFDAAQEMAEWIRDHRDRLVAIGEVGLDFWLVKDEDERLLQRRIFTLFVDLAVELDLPLNVHSRSTGRQAIEILVERGARRVQLHAFDGRAGKARPAVEAGYFFSVPPSIVRSKQKQKLVRQLPLEHLLVETDSPVLGPERESRNEPANAALSAQAVAEIQQLPIAQVEAAIKANTLRLYGDRIAE